MRRQSSQSNGEQSVIAFGVYSIEFSELNIAMRMHDGVLNGYGVDF